jgi:hypothetical protein
MTTHELADENALEAAARALSKLHIEASLEKGSGWRVAARRGARAAITAYLSAMPSRELLAEALVALTRIADLPRYTDGDNEAQSIARAAADKIRAALEVQP